MNPDWFLLTPFVLGIIINFIIKDKEYLCVLLGTIFTLFLGISSSMIIISGDSDDAAWAAAKVTKTIPVAELKLIEMPNNEIQIWYGQNLEYTIKSIGEYKKKDKINRIEYRHIDRFGPDFDRKRVIFNE